jgi:hypothetical protein
LERTLDAGHHHRAEERNRQLQKKKLVDRNSTPCSPRRRSARSARGSPRCGVSHNAVSENPLTWSTGTAGVMKALVSDPIPQKFYTDPAASDANTCVGLPHALA